MRTRSHHLPSLHALAVFLSVASLGGAAALAQNGLPFRIEAPPGSVFFGGSVASGGDANGDGFDDGFIMDHDYDENGVVLGRSFMYSGRTGREMWRVKGMQELDSDGGRRYLVAAFIGDIDGDGCNDIALGQPNADENRGRVDVYSGRTGARRFSYAGTEPEARFGRDVAGVGDVDGDGRPDLAVIARYAHDGRVDLYSGRDGSLIHSLECAWPRCVRRAGDLDGDERSDIAVGGWNSTDRGLGITIFAGDDGSIIRNLERPQPEDTLFGWFLDGGQDLNGDDTPDLVASGRDGSDREPRAYFIDGRTGGATPLVPPVEYPDYGVFGYSVRIADINGDGAFEAIVADTESLISFDTRTGAAVHWSLAARLGRGGVFGTEVAVGDVNGDGLADVITQDIIDAGGVIARAGAPILLHPETPHFFRRDRVFDLVVYHGSPDRRVYFLASRTNAACTFIPRLNLCLNLAGPIVLLGHAVTDAAGFAALEIDATSAPTGPVWFQAVDPTDPQRGAIVSNVMEIEFVE